MAGQDVRFTLTATEYHGAVRLAERHLRSVPEQIRYVLRQALIDEGLVDQQDLERSDDGG